MEEAREDWALEPEEPGHWRERVEFATLGVEAEASSDGGAMYWSYRWKLPIWLDNCVDMSMPALEGRPGI